MEIILVALFLVLAIPAGLYFAHGGGTARAWGLVPDGEQVRGTGAYRVARVRLWKRGEAPVAVRVAAFSSFFLGQMVLPGALAALVGFLVTAAAALRGQAPALLVILTLSAPTGLIVAGRLLGAGTAMLSRADDAAAQAHGAARWALGHNLGLLFALGVGAAVTPGEAEMAALPAAYCLFSLAQGLLVRHAAQAIDAYLARQAEDPAPEAAELAVLDAAS
jgi:hypothetical protein